MADTTNPPIMPDIIPDNKGTPQASEIPKQRGSATRNTTTPAFKSDWVFCNCIVNVWKVRNFAQNL